MNFFTACKAVGADVHVPIYFIESTAPDNVDDTDELPTGPLPHLQLIPDSDDAVRQIAAELGLNASDVQAMAEHLRQGLVTKAPAARLAGEVEVDEVYVVAGHKGQPAAVAKRGGSDGVAG